MYIFFEIFSLKSFLSTFKNHNNDGLDYHSMFVSQRTWLERQNRPAQTTCSSHQGGRGIVTSSWICPCSPFHHTTLKCEYDRCGYPNPKRPIEPNMCLSSVVQGILIGNRVYDSITQNAAHTLRTLSVALLWGQSFQWVSLERQTQLLVYLS